MFFCFFLCWASRNFSRSLLIYICKQPLMMAYERSESARDNFGKFIHQFQPETKTIIRKLERILIKLYRQNVSWLFNQRCLNVSLLPNYAYTHTHTHTHIYIYIYIFPECFEKFDIVWDLQSVSDHHHHHIALVARISLTLSRHSSQSFIALGRSSGQHSVSSHSCWMYVRAGRPAFARPCVGVHKSTSLMSSSLLLQQCPACLVRLTWIVFVQLVSCGVLPPGLVQDCT